MPSSPKPNVNSTLTEIKEYVREYKINKPEIKLTMKKAQLIEGLKKHGHWDGRVKKISRAQKSFLSGIDDGSKKAEPKKKKESGSFNVKNDKPASVKSGSKKKKMKMPMGPTSSSNPY
tara:strand:+ start:762 stop:1115 length:354 start_codon:yes stop_codon:yes gene_type:complete